MKEFYLDSYIENSQKENFGSVVLKFDENYLEFKQLCEDIKEFFNEKSEQDSDNMLKHQKRAILGYEEEVNYYLELIEEYLTKNKKYDVAFPPWYTSLEEAIFHERWGFAGINQWLKMTDSSSCKIIGNRIYFLINGKQQLQKQTITDNRLLQLKKALLLGSPEKRLNEKFHEVYTADGTRITIFNRAKEHSIVFRKYVINTYNFEQQVKLNTIDKDMVPLLEAMVGCGYNVAFTGPVRTGKTTFLTTYQSYEDSTQEGVLIETDPEIPLHKIMPTAPIVQLIADDEELEEVMKPLMRSDGDYLIMGEARTGKALNLAVEITKKGTRRVKMSFHTGNVTNICFDVAQMITKEMGGDVWANMIQVAEGFHYVFAFQQLPNNKSIKKLKGIYEINLDPETLIISTKQICRYEQLTDKWSFKNSISERIREVGYEENPEAFQLFEKELEKLSQLKPMTGEHIKISPYSKLMSNG